MGPEKLYGESLFITVLKLNESYLFLNDHLCRLRSSIKEYYEVDFTLEELRSHFDRSISRHLVSSNCIIRFSAYLRERDELLFDKCHKKSFKFSLNIRKCTLVTNNDVQPVMIKAKEQSKVKLLSTFSPFSFYYPSLKMGSYMPHFYFKKKAIKENADDILFLDSTIKGAINESDAHVVESTTSNIFFVLDKTIYTPKKVYYKGLTREKIASLFPVQEVDIKLSHVKNFDFAFLTNSASLVRGVSSINQINYSCCDEFLDEVILKLLSLS